MIKDHEWCHPEWRYEEGDFKARKGSRIDDDDWEVYYFQQHISVFEGRLKSGRV